MSRALSTNAFIELFHLFLVEYLLLIALYCHHVNTFKRFWDFSVWFPTANKIKYSAIHNTRTECIHKALIKNSDQWARKMKVDSAKTHFMESVFIIHNLRIISRYCDVCKTFLLFFFIYAYPFSMIENELIYKRKRGTSHSQWLPFHVWQKQRAVN